MRVGVFRFVRSPDELARAGLEREHIHAIERMIFNVYCYIREKFYPEDRIQVDIESSDLTLGGVTSALVNVRHADPVFILDCMESIIIFD